MATPPLSSVGQVHMRTTCVSGRPGRHRSRNNRGRRGALLGTFEQLDHTGATHTWEQPFTAERHDALTPAIFRFGRFNAAGLLVAAP